MMTSHPPPRSEPELLSYVMCSTFSQPFARLHFCTSLLNVTASYIRTVGCSLVHILNQSASPPWACMPRCHL